MIPYYFGLVPYEVYVIPGMYVAMLQMIWQGSIGSARFHILPHLFAYSFFQLLKSNVKRTRPGCAYKSMRGAINPGHCRGHVRHESFPSGHTGIAFALVAALCMELFATREPRLFEVPIPETLRLPIALAAIFIACMVSLHRVVGGYHHVGDVLIGASLGSLVGIMTWRVLSNVQQKSHDDNYPLPMTGKLLLTIPISFLMWRFITRQVFELTSIKH
jgi:membrane-associated phospholipid phosphatase